jgi:methylmalonyl-CoA mutase
METGYQRNKIQDESLYYEQKKHDGTLPIIGVNTFRGNPTAAAAQCGLVRSTDSEKQSQVGRLRRFQARHAAEAGAALVCLKQAAIKNENIFSALMNTVRCCSVGQITNALFEVGGQYRRNF